MQILINKAMLPLPLKLMMKMTMKKPIRCALTFLSIFAVIGGLSSCSGEKETAPTQPSSNQQATAEQTTTQTAADVISIENPRIRATPPGQKVTGAFMVLNNASGNAYQLTSAQAEIANVTELHETSMHGETMQMKQVPNIAIPANGQAILKPGSFHVMLIDLKQPVNEGENHKITLTFSDNSQKVVEAPVMKIMK